MHGSTFGGGPATTAAALWVMSKITRPATLAGVRRKGRTLMKGLEALVAKHASLGEARGLGLITAIEIAPGAPYELPALVSAARDHGLLLVRGGERAVRVLPPLNVTEAELATALERLDIAVTALERAGGTQ
jgi:acetylornithine/N-succinyldiaminopimelate aminotransferase